jgi:Protein of unknown function (DUF2752)
MQNGVANKYGLLGLGLLFLLGFVLLWQFDPNQAGSPLPPCPFYWLTGWYCPGCGATRAMHALVHGDIAKALAMNPLLVLALPLVVLLLLHRLRALPEKLRSTALFFSDARPWAAVIISYALLRNMPWYPFSWLAPG